VAYDDDMNKVGSSRRPEGHPIQVAAKRTGLTPEVLRVWEKRYGAVRPARTATGRRAYSDEDIERLRLLRQATLAGRRVGEVAGLSTGALGELVREDEREERQAPPARGGAAGSALEAPPAAGAAGPSAALPEALDAVRDLDPLRLEAILTRAVMLHGSDQFVERMAGPLLRAIGDEWKEGRLEPYREHAATEVIRQVVGRMLSWGAPGPGGATLVAGTPAGQRHEIGSMLAASAARSEGWLVIYLGPDLPASDIARAALRAGADLVALSIVHPADDPAVNVELRDLRTLLPKSVRIVAGGAAAGAYARVLREIDAEVLSDLAGFRAFLARIRASRPLPI